MPRNRGVDDTDPLPLRPPDTSPRSWKVSSSIPQQQESLAIAKNPGVSLGTKHPPSRPRNHDDVTVGDGDDRTFVDHSPWTQQERLPITKNPGVSLGTKHPPSRTHNQDDVTVGEGDDRTFVDHSPSRPHSHYDDVSVEREDLGRCPSLNLEWLLRLQDKKKGIAAHNRRGSLLVQENTTTISTRRRSVIEEEQIVDVLLAESFTSGLARTLIQHLDQFPIRIWLVDNSGSMNASDGHLAMVQKSSSSNSTTTMSPRIENANCTRWEEVTSCVMWHAKLSAMLGAPMAVRLINDPGINIGPQQLGVAASDKRDVQQEVKRLKHVLGTSRPGGTSALTVHLKDIIDSLVDLGPKLRQRHESVAIVIVTDGLPTNAEGQEGAYVNDEFINTLQRLRGLPVWVVIRLSTDEKRVVDFYNDLDFFINDDTNHNVGRYGVVMATSGGGSSSNAMNLDVLDDFFCEAKEVHEHNPWLNYALPLHLCRESGVTFPSFDALDNRLLTPNELADFVAILFDCRRDHANVMLASDGAAQTTWTTGHALPNPSSHYQDFRDELVQMIRNERNLFHPIKNKMLPWINVKELDRIYGATQSDMPCACNVL